MGNGPPARMQNQDGKQEIYLFGVALINTIVQK